MPVRCFLVAVVMTAAAHVPAPAWAQSFPPPSTLRGVPSATAPTDPIQLSLADAVSRGLQHNLAVILEEQRLTGTRSARLSALAEVLPHVSGSVRQSQQTLSTAAFGFTFPGLPTVIGPFGVFDSRIAVSTPIVDARAIGGLRAVKAEVRAGESDFKDMRETVVLAVGNLYLQTEADAARVESAKAQVSTAEALVRLAEDQKGAGLVAGIDVVRQQVQLQSARARLIVAQNAFEKRKLSLARAIGLAAGQEFSLSDSTAFTPAPPMTIEDAVSVAAANREDLKAAQARVDAARATRAAEAAGHLPSFHLDADIGAIGPRASDLERTYSVAAIVRVPLFDGGATRAKVQRAETELHAREAELADLNNGLRFDVQATLLDVNAADAGVAVADSARTLARQELDQAQDRFRAGVANTLELVEAQEAVATASEQYISSVYAHAVAKATLARALGQVERRFVEFVGGKQ
jgi:outer membrane protein TolC